MRLSINIDHVATLRNARGGTEPDPVAAALTCEQSGADGIVCHLREDRRHIRDIDVLRLRKNITTRLDLEMAATSEIITIAQRIKPDLVTLVPEKRKELTTEGGLDVHRLRHALRRAVQQLQEHGIPVSLFIDPLARQIEAAKEVGAVMVEIHTGKYADAHSVPWRKKYLNQIKGAARYARGLGLVVNAGHGLDYNNIKQLRTIREIEEVSIGHAIVVRAMSVGIRRAVQEMVALVAGRGV